MTNFKIKVKVPSAEHELKVGSKQATGLDIRAHLPDGAVTINARNSAVISTGLFIKVDNLLDDELSLDAPQSLYPDIQVRGRSGLAFNYDIEVHRGTIDADYRGEVKIKLYNHSYEPFVVKDKDRIAQLVIGYAITPHALKELEAFEIVDEIENDTERGTDGFGSTGTS